MSAEPPVPPCPRCAAGPVVRNGRLRSGTQQFLCRACGRRFVASPRKGPVADDRKELVRRLLRERVSLRGVARETRPSRSWVQNFVNGLYREDTPHDPGPLKKPRPAILTG